MVRIEGFIGVCLGLKTLTNPLSGTFTLQNLCIYCLSNLVKSFNATWCTSS